MKRFISLFLALILLPLAFPRTAIGESAQSHSIDADQVLIYNPLPYDAKGNTLFSGTIVKAPDDEEPNGDATFTPGLHKTGSDLSRATKDPKTHDFWVCTDLNTYRYDKCTFRLAAEGAHCCIWTMEGDTLSFTEEQTAAMLEQFETVIYPSDTAYFGGFRDLDGTGKLQIVTYAMNSASVCGFFDLYDLYTHEEIEIIDPDDSESYNYLPIINVNARMADREQIVYGTLAHEFQHLILRSAVLESPANADRLGQERSIGSWLNEGFSMAAEELAYPGSVEQQGYVDAYNESDKIRLGMSFQNFDATATDVGAYGQSFLFTEYLRTQCGNEVFGNILDYWRTAESVDSLTEGGAICAQLSEAQIEALHTLCAYSDAMRERIGSEDAVLLSKFGLAYRLAAVLQAESGMFAIGSSQPSVPVYEGTGRRIEGGGALLVSCSGNFTVPADADSGLIFVGMKDGAVTEVYTVLEPEEGFYVLAAEYDGKWYALPAEPSADRIIKPIELTPNADGSLTSAQANGAIFEVRRAENGFRVTCDDRNGFYTLGRTATTKQTLSVGEADCAFSWTHFADGSDRLQADGFYGRALLYGSVQRGFGYYAPAYFENETFAKPVLIRISLMNGDANLDGRITAADAALVLRTVVGLSYMNAPMRAAGDMDGNGEITAADAAKILRIVVRAEH
jgi:hypothetical protein